MNQRPLAHGGFTIERRYDAPREEVFAAWSNIEIKAKWFVGPEGWTLVRREQTFEPAARKLFRIASPMAWNRITPRDFMTSS